MTAANLFDLATRNRRCFSARRLSASFCIARLEAKEDAAAKPTMRVRSVLKVAASLAAIKSLMTGCCK
jgi:hypothetical protein